MQDASTTTNPVTALLEDVLDRSRLVQQNGGPLNVSYQAGHPESRLVLIAGDNASGKSLMIRILAGWLNEAKVEPLQVSMRYRTMSGMHRMFMFGLGDEEDSTGNVSLTAINGAMKTAEGREKPCWMMLDEPDTGMSEGYCAAMGTYLANFGNRVVPLNHCQGMVVVTHSRKLISSMLFTLEKQPHFLCFSDAQGPDLLTAWLEDERDRSVEELLALNENSHELFKRINKVLNSKPSDA